MTIPCVVFLTHLYETTQHLSPGLANAAKLWQVSEPALMQFISSGILISGEDGVF